MAIITGSRYNDDVRVGGGGIPTSKKGLTLSSTDDADSIRVNNGNDVVLAGGGGDEVFGGNGKDWIEGGADNDTLWGENGIDSLFGQDGNDIIHGGNGADLIDGGADDDTLFGDNGPDTLIGGLGVDTMNGGNGPDTFVFNFVSDSPFDDPDSIIGFKTRTDELDFSAIDADASTLGDQAFSWGGTLAGANSVWYANDGTNTYVYADTTGDGVADMEVHLTGVIALVEGDFIL